VEKRANIEEEEEEEQVPETRIDVEVPKIKTDLGKYRYRDFMVTGTI
jgi:hypothetical protein